ncbi:MAG: hypothetical protein JO339_09900, partial [Alphaproteobacteria bacterium]|nr:hypothetical protein [Alphaproteobacteria bacterium]
MASVVLNQLRPRLSLGIDKRLLLTPELLAAPHISDQWLCLLGDDELLVFGAEISPQDEHGAFKITGQAEFLGLENVPVEIWLFSSSDPTGLVEEQLECVILPRGLDRPWDLQTFFDPPPLLPRWDDEPEPVSLLEGMSFAEPRFAYSSFDFCWTTGADGFDRVPALVQPAGDGPALQAGINLKGQIAASGPAWADLKAINPGLAA